MRAMEAVRHAFLAASLSLVVAGCCFGRSYGPEPRITVQEVAPALVASARVRADGRLDDDACKAACGEDVVRCAPAALDPKLPPHAAPRAMSCECDAHDGSPVFERRRMLDARELDDLHPDADAKLDPRKCSDWSCCGKDAAMLACRLDPPLPGPPPVSPEERVVVCETVTPGGCDMAMTRGPAPPATSVPAIARIFSRCSR
jgi:hypothetical protein